MSAGGLGQLRNAVALFVLAAVWWGQPRPPQESTVERIETGRARLANGTEAAYRIRLLPVASFPALPATIAKQLQQKNCMVPQTYEARQPENVIHGAFEKKGSEDWAVLCSGSGVTTLYVFFQSHSGDAVALRHQPDADWLGSEIAGRYGSAWGISVRPPSQIHSAKLRGERIDHSGIDDAFLEHSSTVHYFEDGEWIMLEPGN